MRRAIPSVAIAALILAWLSIGVSPSERYIFPIVLSQAQPKIGLAWGATHCPDASSLNLPQRGAWYYRWQSNPNGCSSQMRFVPLYRPGETWNQPLSYDGYCLFLNEPDRCDQDCLTPLQAANEWISFRQIAPNCRAIVLNVARGDNTWYPNEWRSKVKQLTGSYPIVTGYGFHAYGTKSQILAQVNAFRNWMTSTNQGDLQMWLTEFGGCYAANRTQISASDLQSLINQFEAWNWLTRYAWYPTRWNKPGDPSPPPPVCTTLFAGDTQLLTPLGIVIANGANGYP